MNKLKTLLAAVCCLCAANKAAAYDFSAVNDGQTIYYNIISSTPPLTVGVTYENFSQGSYNGEITIPDMVSYNGNTYSVTAIGYRAFYECTALTSVTIPNSVTTIGGYAFHSCTGLTSVTIGNSVTVIQNAVFYGCTGLTSITIPESVTDIGQSAFAHCSGLTSITIPNSVTMIEDWAFEFCSSLTSVTIPNSVTSIGREVLNSCSSLTSIIVEANNPNYCSVDDVLFNKSQSTLKQYPGGKQGSYTIPNTVTTIEYAAFSGCNLTSVTIPNSVTSIRGGTFVGCHSLISLTVEEDNPNYCSVGGVLFDKSKDTLIQYPGGKTGSYTTPYTVTTIGGAAFYDCRATSVIISNAVTTIGYSAFYNCTGLTSVTIGSSVTTIGDYAFATCTGLTEIHVKAKTPPQIGDATFYNVPTDIPVYVCGNVETYKRVNNWRNFTNILQDNNCEVAVEDLVAEDIISIYPNPATENIIISLREMITNAVFTLYDMQGRVLIRQAVSNEDVISVNEFAAGLYIYSISTAKGNLNGKITIVNN